MKSGKSRRLKGLSFERDIARRLRGWFPDAKRGLQSQYGSCCPDIVGTPYYIECKHNSGKRLREGPPSTLIERQRLRFTKWKEEHPECREIILVWKLDHRPVWVGRVNNLGIVTHRTWEDFEKELDAEQPRVTVRIGTPRDSGKTKKIHYDG